MKSPGPDDIYSEILKLVGEENIDRLLYHVFNQIYETDNIPDDWLECVLIPF